MRLATGNLTPMLRLVPLAPLYVIPLAWPDYGPAARNAPDAGGATAAAFGRSSTVNLKPDALADQPATPQSHLWVHCIKGKSPGSSPLHPDLYSNRVPW